jgi:tetratricopeptide (TPR) repeat protein
MLAAGELTRFSGERAEALELKLELLSLERDRLGVERPGTLLDLADMALEHGNLVGARTYVDEALAFERTPRALASLGDVLLHEGQLDEAERIFAEARDGFLGQHDYNHALMILALGDVARRRGDRGRSMDLFAQALLRFRELGDQAGVGDAIEGFATLVFADDETAAARLIGAARRHREEWGRPPALHVPIIGLSDREVEVGRGMSLEEAIELARALGASIPAPTSASNLRQT